MVHLHLSNLKILLSLTVISQKIDANLIQGRERNF